MRAWAGAGPARSSGLDRVDPLPARRARQPDPADAARSSCSPRYLRDEGRYSDGAAPGSSSTCAGHDLDRLIDGFLLAARPVGDDEQYASAMALLANRVGVPARVVVGAVLPRDGRVRGEDVHAWVEVRVADGSWRTLPTREFMGRTPPRPRRCRARRRATLPTGARRSPPSRAGRSPTRPAERGTSSSDADARRSLVVRIAAVARCCSCSPWWCR